MCPRCVPSATSTFDGGAKLLVTAVKRSEPACKRGSVHRTLAGDRLGDHPSTRPTWGVGRAVLPRLGLAPSGVCRAARVTPGAGALLPHRFTLTCARKRAIGGLFSVALSCGSPRLAVSQHPALWSPDFPRPDPPEGA